MALKLRENITQKIINYTYGVYIQSDKKIYYKTAPKCKIITQTKRTEEITIIIVIIRLYIRTKIENKLLI
jgi:hypothetical protein